MCIRDRAHIVRKIKRTENINVPWLFFLNIDSSYTDLHSRYQAIFDQGKELGIYVYCLYTDGNPEKLLPLIEHNPDCAMKMCIRDSYNNFVFSRMLPAS